MERTSKMAPYILKGGRWVDANASLDIRDVDTMNSPTNAKVPRVYARTGAGWDQIYPPKEQPGGGGDINSSRLKSWQGSPSDNGIWGWAYGDGTANGWTAAEGYFGDGSYSHETNIHKEYAGWTDITLASLRAAGYKGLGTKDTPGKVKKVTKVTFSTNHKAGTGYPGHVRKLGLVLTNVPNPFMGNPGTSSSVSPIVQRSSIMWSDNSASLASNGGAPESNRWNTWVYTNPGVMEMFKDFLNGKYDNLITFNGHRPGNYPVWSTNGSDGHRPLYMTMDYFKIKGVKIRIDYTYEP